MGLSAMVDKGGCPVQFVHFRMTRSHATAFHMLVPVENVCIYLLETSVVTLRGIKTYFTCMDYTERRDHWGLSTVGNSVIYA